MADYFIINTDTNEVYNKIEIDSADVASWVPKGEEPTNSSLVAVSDISEHPYEREIDHWQMVTNDEDPNGELVTVGNTYYIQVDVAPYPSWTKNSDGLWTPPVAKPDDDPEPENPTPETSELMCWVEANTSWVRIRKVNASS